jgi:hypothetical protein
MRYLLLAVALVACGSHSGDDDSTAYNRIEIEPATASVTVTLGATATQDYVVYGITASGKRDITTDCALTIDATFGTFAGATVTIGSHGGKTSVAAACGELAGSADLIVNLTGDVIQPPAPSNAPQLFGTATVGTDTARVPAVEYPIDGAVSPRNMPPIEIQWTAGANDLFKVTLQSSFVAVNIYTTSLDTLLTDADWGNITETTAGDNLTVGVEGLAQAAPAAKFVSAPTTLHIARDTIDRTAIYWWASSQGNIMSQQFGTLSAPSLVKDDCTSCHSVSRAGTRIGYSRCVGVNGANTNDCGELYAGFMKYDNSTKAWVDVVDAHNKTIHGSYTTFAPVGNPFPTDDQSVAIVAMASGAKLSLYDPDTGTPIASNLEVQSQKGPGEPRSGTMPDWSPDGTKVAYASTPHANEWIDLNDGRIAIMSYAYTGGQHVFGDPQFLIADPITLAGGSAPYTNFYFPSFSPDGKLIVFNAARSGWRNFADARTPGQRLMLADANGAWVTDMPAINGGFDDRDITWAHWAPTVGSDYYWLVFSSQRDYGHKLTEGNTAPGCIGNGVRQCKQLWIGAVARNRLTGAIDPSSPPMWMPGQDLGADNISPYWTVPTTIQ